MLTAVIRAALRQRTLALAFAALVMIYGIWCAGHLPIDVFPDLNRPRVVVMTEAHGMAPEEVESLITFPLESALNGAPNVQAVRSYSSVGLSVIYVEFDWGTNIYDDRQIVNERLATAAERLPRDVTPHLAPISSIMGQILIAGVYADGSQTSPLELRTLADWDIRQRLLAIPGVSQVITMGGERKQFQVLVDPDALRRYGVTLHEVKEALRESNQNTTGGYLDQQGPQELLVRSLGRVRSVEEIGEIVVKYREGRSVVLSQVARIVEGAQTKRGDSSAYVRAADGTWLGGRAVAVTINKQPDADTRQVTQAVHEALSDLQETLPKDVRIFPNLYEQRTFIDLSIENVAESLRDGSLLVLIVLVVFLLNLRVTLITLTAIPLSLAMTALVFHFFGLSINTMTLGGLAVAIGELVDDAIVDVENIFRRLRENRLSDRPAHPIRVVYRASCEIRNSIVFGTAIVVLVFIPLFALEGMEGRLFAPLGVAYIVSILCSLVVSLTVTPVLSYWLLGKVSFGLDRREGLVLRCLKRLVEGVMRLSLAAATPLLLVTGVAVLVAGVAVWRLERDFLPPFNEGAVQINVLLPPGTSLAKTNEVCEQVEQRLRDVEELTAFVRKTGRAEMDEHAEGVNVTEVIATIDPRTDKTRSQVIDEISASLEQVPGITISVEQPLAHLISHMLSGVKAQVAIKLYGDNLETLRREAARIRNAIAAVPGVRDPQVEPQANIPQLRIEADGKKLRRYGLRRLDVNEYVETALRGEVVSQIVDQSRSFDLLVRLDEPYREDLDVLRRLVLRTPGGGQVKLSDVADIYRSSGPNQINRDKVRRRIVVQCNVSGRGVVDVVRDIQQRIAPIKAELPTGYTIEYGGQFESQQSAARTITLLFLVALVGIFLVLYTMFGSMNLALQVMVALPTAFLGAVAALYLTGQTLTVAGMVGFVSLCGIASRNGILLLNHYLYLVQQEGEGWTKEMIIRAGRDRLAPVVMTALTSGIGLVPLALAAGEPGKEILYPVATVIIGGLVSSTLLEFCIRPALFWKLGVPAARRITARAAADALSDESPATS